MIFKKYINESARPIEGSIIDDMDKRCDKCDTLLNDMGKCPVCDEGEVDIDTDVLGECKKAEQPLVEARSAKELLDAAFPGVFNWDNSSPESEITEAVVTEELSAYDKLLQHFPELAQTKKSVDDSNTLPESVSSPAKDEYDDNYDFEDDDFEADRIHAALYGGDRMYCKCGKKLVMDEWGGHCPDCDAVDFDTRYDD